MVKRLKILSAFLLLPFLACSGEEPPADLAQPPWSPVGPGGPTGPCAAVASWKDDTASGFVSPEALKTCIAKGPSTADCLDPVFKEYLAHRSTKDALAMLQCYGDLDVDIRAGCHPVAHAIGRETFRVTGTVDLSFQACDQTCLSGCYHGALERFLRGDAPGDGHISLRELQKKAALACDPALPFRLLFQCLHGLGHAVMYFSGYDLRSSLTVCEATGGSWHASACFGGVFMENIVAAERDKRDVSPTDYQYPCNSLDTKYRADCYLLQTSRMREMGLTAAQILVECGKAGAHRNICIQSLGRDLSDEVRVGGGKSVASTCGLAKGDDRTACIRGVVFSLVDNRWDAHLAFPHCTDYADALDARYCFETTASYLKWSYSKTADEILAQCRQYVPGNEVCLTASR